MSTSRSSLPGLAARGARAVAGPAALVAVVVFAAAFLLGAWPRMLDQLATAETRYQVTATAPSLMDPSAQTPTWLLAWTESEEDPVLPEELWPTWGAWDVALRAARDSQPSPLREALGDPVFRAQASSPLSTSDTPPDRFTTAVTWSIDPFIAEHLEIVEGAAPAPMPHEPIDEIASSTEPEAWTVLLDPDTRVRVEVMMSVYSAEQMRWEVGQARDVRDQGMTMEVVLSGVFEAVDPNDPFWQHTTGVLVPDIRDDPNSGVSVTSAVFVDPVRVDLLQNVVWEWTSTFWYPLDAGAVTAANAPQMLAQSRALVADPLPQPPGAVGWPTLAMESALPDVLDGVLARRAGLEAVLALVAAGPVGVTLAVVALGCRMLLLRREPVLALTRARGASPGQLRGLLAAEGLAIGVVPAVAGAVGAALVIPASTTLTTWALPAVVAFAPAVVLGLRHDPGAPAEQRSAGGGRWRWVAEMTVVVATLASLVLLTQRGLVAGAAEQGVDPLVAAAPLLLALTAAIACARTLPLILGVLRARFRRARGLVGSLGSTRGARAQAATIAPVLAVVVGVAVAVFAASLLPTLRAGAEQQALRQVGADLRASGPAMTPEMIAAISALDDVEDVSPVANNGVTTLIQGLTSVNAYVYAVDVDALRRIQAEVPGAPSLPQELGAAIEETAGVVLSQRFAEPGVEPGAWSLGFRPQVPISVAETGAEAPGITTGTAWVIVDAGVLAEFTDQAAAPRILLIGLSDEADIDAVAGQVSTLLGGGAVTSAGDRLAQFDASPAASGMASALTLTAAVSIALAAVASALTLVVGAPARAATLGVLRTLGVRPREETQLVLWEIVPLLLIAVVGGSLVGAALGPIVLGSVDLRAFTGGTRQPELVVDPLLLAGGLGGLVASTAIAVVIAVVLARRRTLASVLRMGDAPDGR